MATILISTEDLHVAEQLKTTVDGLGHTALHVLTTENVSEDVVLNRVDLVLATLNTVPFDGFAVSMMLRGDPDVPDGLPIVLVTETAVDPRRVEKAGLSDVIEGELDTAYLNEVLVRHLGDAAAPGGSGPLSSLGLD